MNDSYCPSSAVADFHKRVAEAGIGPKMVRVNGLTLANAILAGILVGIRNYGTSYRHRAFVRALFLGANTLFLPILSYVASNAASTTVPSTRSESQTQGFYISISCDVQFHLFLVLIWAGLVHIVGINTCTTVAASKREGRIIGLPMVLLVQAIWSSYLVVSSFLSSLIIDPHGDFDPTVTLLPITFALIFCKIVFKYYAFQKAQLSFAFGRNPPLIVGYMKQLQGGTVEHYCPPPLIVMGEDRDDVDKGAHGFFFKRIKSGSSGTGLVSSTMDKVWQFNDDDTGLKSSTTWRLKEVCLSFSLFKLLRCRFAGYTVAEAGFLQVRDFFMHLLLNDKDHQRVHGMITDELSFLHDYYYSSIPINYSNFWLPVVSICISLLTISLCLLLAGLGDYSFSKQDLVQVNCKLMCFSMETFYLDYVWVNFGNLVYDVVPVAILLVSVVLAETREIASYICSNWTKVALFSGYVVNNHDAWQRSPRMQKWIGRVLRCRCNKLMTHWDDKMYQCSVLVLHPRRIDPIISLVMRILRLPDGKKNVKVPGVLKARIFSALTSYNGLLTDPKTFLCRSLSQEDVGSDDFLWACESEGISDILLTWHITTSILELRQGQHSPPIFEDMIVATHLSRYCAYLVAYVPELLPDDDGWCKSLYMAVKKDSMLALDDGVAVAAPSTTEEAYIRLVTLLEKAEHVVLKKGVKLGKQLVELQQRREQATWRFLAGFWSGMILYIAPSNNLKGHAAPSENLKGHAEAIARGGELITLVWALLMNVGIDSRPSSTEASPSTVDDVWFDHHVVAIARKVNNCIVHFHFI